jgi:hypothetical protein
MYMGIRERIPRICVCADFMESLDRLFFREPEGFFLLTFLRVL